MVIALVICVYSFGYNNGRNKVLVNTYEKENKALAQTISDADKRIKGFNSTSQADFEKSILESEQRQREYIASQARKTLLEDKTRTPNTVYVKCIADKEVTDKINASIRAGK